MLEERGTRIGKEVERVKCRAFDIRMLMECARYPGVRCDVPSHCYQYTFESNSQWSEYYAEGAEIRRYFQRTAKKFDVYKYIKFKHMLKGATWDAEAGKWHIRLEDMLSGTVCLCRDIPHSTQISSPHRSLPRPAMYSSQLLES